ncbi:hypothetical protein V5O48_011302 [Marasmius crinis-equi]|uniref:BRCT domain-containing protein n=1 Tax=Marasmius crinis-equi TaxID=585013 RepID=A0ABR3F607_9AGAR
MLFNKKKACFSPEVPRHFRHAWVENGGSLTHSKQDFFDADYFFCAGMEDAWLKTLHSRNLIVRHAGWIAECVEENFLMPCSKYILDERFDARGIELQPQEVFDDLVEEIDPETTRITSNTSAETTLCQGDSTLEEIQADLATSSEPTTSSPRLNRKRTFEKDFGSDDGSLTKRRQCDPPSATTVLIPTCQRKTTKKSKTQYDKFIKIIDTALGTSSVSVPPKHPFDDPADQPNQKLLSCPPRLALSLLLSLPETESTLFKPSSTYGGKTMWCTAQTD